MICLCILYGFTDWFLKVIPVHDSCLSLLIQEFLPFVLMRCWSIMRKCYLGSLIVCLFLTYTKGHDQEDSQAGLLLYFSFLSCNNKIWLTMTNVYCDVYNTAMFPCRWNSLFNFCTIGTWLKNMLYLITLPWFFWDINCTVHVHLWTNVLLGLQVAAPHPMTWCTSLTARQVLG